MGAMRNRVALLTAVALLGAGSLAACGDDDDDDASGDEATSESAGGPAEVTVVADATEGGYSFELSDTPTAETTSIVFDNQDSEPHFLVYAKINEGFTVDEAVKLEGKKGSADVLIEQGAGPGQTKEFAVEGPVDPGDYAMLCPIPSPKGAHYELGQLKEFSIE